MKKTWILFVVAWLLTGSIYAQILRKPIPDKLVVLTFDDAVASHASYVAPLLKKYGFGATFFIAEFPPDFSDKTKFMTWKQIKQLDKMGFEVGNHTQAHRHVNKMKREEFIAQLDSIELHCRQNGIKKPVSFAYPGYDTHPSAFPVLSEKNYIFARTGGARAYNPAADNPLLVPSFSTTGTDKQRVLDAIGQAKDGKIVVFTIHGVPDLAHPKVTTPPELFAAYMKYLYDNKYKVISLRDLAKYVNVKEASKLPTLVKK